MDFEPDFNTFIFNGLEVSTCEALLDDTHDFGVSDCAYYLRIQNNSPSIIRLLGKDFCFTDASGINHYEIGPGFNGEIPVLYPGEFFEFSSRAPLTLSDAVLHGSCLISRDNETLEKLRFPLVFLNSHRQKAIFLPHTLH